MTTRRYFEGTNKEGQYTISYDENSVAGGAGHGIGASDGQGGDHSIKSGNTNVLVCD